VQDHLVAQNNVELLYGRNPVREALRAGSRQVQRIWLARGAQEKGALGEILSMARTDDIPIKAIERSALDEIASGHQGIAAEVSSFRYCELSAILGRARAQGEALFVLLLDLIQDPQNLGTLIRTAEAVGVHGVILPQRRAAHVTPAVVSASAGATEHIAVAIHNLAQAIDSLKQEGVWVVGLDIGHEAQPFQQLDLGGSIGLVVGSEGSGMRRLVRESCDFLARLPMRGRIESLNASVAGSIMLYEIWRAREYAGSQ
jgi:23S rRNA (guanosine2251-2'-O)-methyltransferase